MAEISRIERRQSGEMSAAYLEDIRQERARLALIEQRIKELYIDRVFAEIIVFKLLFILILYSFPL